MIRSLLIIGSRLPDRLAHLLLLRRIHHQDDTADITVLTQRYDPDPAFEWFALAVDRGQHDLMYFELAPQRTPHTIPQLMHRQPDVQVQERLAHDLLRMQPPEIARLPVPHVHDQLAVQHDQGMLLSV